MKGRQLVYSREELAWIETMRELPRRAAHKLFVALFDRADVSADNYKALCNRKRWKTGRDGRLKPGNVPANKGKPMPFNANSAATRFKKGNLPHTTRYLGHERVSKDGYVEISVAETNPHTGFERRYVLKHRWLWEQANGPLSAGMCLKCLDGDRQNTDPANWQAIPRALLPRLNGGPQGAKPIYDAAPDELKPTILLLAQLDNAGRRRRARAA